MRAHWTGADNDCLETIRALYRVGQGIYRTESEDVLAAIGRATLGLTEQDRAVVHYVSKLTIASGTVTHHDVLELTNAGLSDREIHDIVMVSSCFAFMNRLADGTGVALQKNRYPFAVTLFGQEALDEHLIWANA